MTRKDLTWSGGMLLAMGAAVWFWGENRELQGRMAEREDSSAEAMRSADRSDNPSRAEAPRVASREQDSPDGSQAPRSVPEPRSGNRPFHKVSTGMPGVQVPGVTEQKRSTAGSSRTVEEEQAPGLIDSGKPAEVVAVSAVEAEKNGESLFKNGGFDKELAPWTSKEARIVNEPGNPANSILEINPKEGTYSLSQELQRSPASRELLLTFRMMGTQDELTPITITVLGRDGKERPVLSTALQNSAEWSSQRIEIPLSGARPLAISLKGSSAKNPLRLDDVVLREVRSDSFSPGQ